MLPTEKTPPRSDLSSLSLLIYGPSKIGKSTWCSKADGALFLATEAGLNHLDVYQLLVPTWDAFLGAAREIAEGKHNYRTIVIDTVDNLHRLCSDAMLAKHKIEHESDLPYGKGHAFVQNEFARVLTKLSLLPYGLHLISHSTEKEIETRTGKVTRIVPTLPDKARKFVCSMVDLILYADSERTEQGGVRRVLRTKPSPHFDAGDRTGRLPETIDLDYARFVEAFAPAKAAPPAAATTKKSAA